MNKWNQFKQAIKTPPPERLLRIEYQSHFLNMLGVIVVAIILILKGYWYVTLAFVFSLGVSYSQGMVALQKYRIIMERFQEPKTIPEQIAIIENEISPIRKKTKIITLIAGRRYGWLIMLISVSIAMILMNPFGSPLLFQIVFALIILPIYLILYFGVAYSLIKPIYDRKYRTSYEKEGETEERTLPNTI